MAKTLNELWFDLAAAMGIDVSGKTLNEVMIDALLALIAGGGGVGALLAANNLSDLDDAQTAIVNLLDDGNAAGAAHGTLTYASNIANNQTFSIGGETFTVKDLPIGNHDIQRVGSLAGTLANVPAVVNAIVAADASVTASATVLSFTALTAGYAGNTIPLSAGTSGGTASGAFLTGGFDALIPDLRNPPLALQQLFGSAYTFAPTLTGNTAVMFPTSGTLATTADVAGASASGVNPFVNGDFTVAQLGASFALDPSVASIYTLDGVVAFCGAGNTVTVSQITIAPNTTGLPPGAAKGLQWAVNAASTGSALGLRIEYADALGTAQRTWSVYGRVTSGTASVQVDQAQCFGTGGSPSGNVTTSMGALSLTSTFQRLPLTWNPASVSGKTFGTTVPRDDYVDYRLTVSSGVNKTIQLVAVRDNVGASAAPFSPLDTTDSFYRCGRYRRTSYAGVAAGTITSDGTYMQGAILNDYRQTIDLGQMRGIPAANVYSPSTGTSGKVTLEGGADYDAAITFIAATSMLIYSTANLAGSVYCHWVASAEIAT